ncbi:MAG: transposase [Burkholderiales bacterium]
MPRIPRPVCGASAPRDTTGQSSPGDVLRRWRPRSLLGRLVHHCLRFRVEVLAYCLMTNHVHLVVVPKAESALEKTFRPLHTRYAQCINRARGWTGPNITANATWSAEGARCAARKRCAPPLD